MSTSQLHIVVTTVAARRNYLSDCFFVERMSYKYCRRGEASTAIGYGTVLGAPEFVGLVGLSSTTQSNHDGLVHGHQIMKSRDFVSLSLRSCHLAPHSDGVGYVVDVVTKNNNNVRKRKFILYRNQ